MDEITALIIRSRTTAQSELETTKDKASAKRLAVCIEDLCQALAPHVRGSAPKTHGGAAHVLPK